MATIPSPILSKAVSLPAQTVQKCCRLILRRLFSLYDQTSHLSHIYSFDAIIYLSKLIREQGLDILFSWEPCLGKLIVVYSTDQGYKITKFVEIPKDPIGYTYHADSTWSVCDLDSEINPLWHVLTVMTSKILGEDLHTIAQSFLHSQMFLKEIWEKACHPEAVERSIQRLGGLEAYLDNFDAVSPVCMLVPPA